MFNDDSVSDETSNKEVIHRPLIKGFSATDLVQWFFTWGLESHSKEVVGIYLFIFYLKCVPNTTKN